MRRTLAISMAFLVCGTILPSRGAAQALQWISWTSRVAAQWPINTSWQNWVIPNGPDMGASFGAINNKLVEVHVHDPVTVGGIIIDSPVTYGFYGIPLHLYAAGAGGSIDVRQGTHIFSGGIHLGETGRLNVHAGATVQMDGPLGSAPESSLIKVGAGTLMMNMSGAHHGLTDIREGVVELGTSDALGSTGASTCTCGCSGDGAHCGCGACGGTTAPVGAGAPTIVRSGATLAVNMQTIATTAFEDVSISGAGVGGAGAIHSHGAGGILGAITLDNSATIRVDDADLTVTSVEGAAAHTITKAGPGRLNTGRIRAGAVIINAGAAAVTTPRGNDATSRIGDLQIASGAILDLAENNLIYDSGATGTAAQVREMLIRGFHGGAWDGDGINSSAAAQNASSRTALGYIDNATAGLATFNGQQVSTNSILVGYTLYGDANLDGVVDTIDVNLLEANFSAGDASWWQGDFNYDGHVDSIDMNYLASNFAVSLDQLSSGIVVPESETALPTLGAILLRFARRRRAGA